MAIKNLTPHTVTLLDKEGNLIMAIPSHGVARVSVSRELVDTIPFEHNGVTVDVPVNRSKFGEVEGLPSPEPNTLLIVSMVVAKALPNRDDLICPDLTVRDNEGRIVGCQGFCRP